MDFLEWKCLNSDSNFLKFVPRQSVNNIPALVQIMAWCRPGNNQQWLVYCRIYAALSLNELIPHFQSAETGMVTSDWLAELALTTGHYPSSYKVLCQQIGL